MRLLHVTLLFLILLGPFASAQNNTLDGQDKQAVEKIVKNLTNELFLLETTQYKSKKLQNELLEIMPDKISAESEYEPISKKEYINFSKKLAMNRENRVETIIQKDVSPVCHYIEDGSIDCDFKERIKIIEKADVIPQKPHEFEAGTEYKFNLKMNASGEWYINKMKTWNAIPAPQMSTLEVEKKHRQEELKNKRSRAKASDIEVANVLPTCRGDMPTSKASRQKKTDVELAEEEADKEEQERLFQEYQENRRILEQSNAPKTMVDRNGNIISRDINESSSDSRMKKRLKSSRKIECHPFYGCNSSLNRGKLWKPAYAASYAIKYAENYNTYYRSFSNDCANFVSQALTEGGWQNDGGWYKSDSAWWYNSWSVSWLPSQTYTWAGANNLKEYMFEQVKRGNVSYDKYWNNLRMGDVLSLSLVSGKVADHTMIVTSIRNGEMHLSAHTRSRKDKPWSEIDPKGRYYGWGFQIKRGNLNY